MKFVINQLFNHTNQNWYVKPKVLKISRNSCVLENQIDEQ